MKTRQLARNLMLLLTIVLVATGIGNAWADTQQISLSSGWNFISLQIEPNLPDIDNVLSGLDVESVWYYDSIRAMNDMDPWLCHKPDNPFFLNNLYEIHARKGYWVEMNSPDTLFVEGEIPTTSITCYPGPDDKTGWNAVGFFSPTNNYTVEELLELDVYDSIWGHTPDSDNFVQLDADDVLEPGKAYWIETSKGFELTPDIGYLEGTVVDNISGQPITEATVILTGTGITEYCTTLGNGAFSFYVPDFPYLLNVQAPGYKSAQKCIIFDHTSPESIIQKLSPVAKGTIITDFVESTHNPLEIFDATTPDIPGKTLDSMAVNQAGAIESLIVFLDISHKDISEVVVTLVSPEGTSCILHNRMPGENLIGAFHLENSFLGENPEDTWTLKITDHVPDNKGTLNSWSLTVNLVSGTVPDTWATDLSPMPGPGSWLGSSGSPVLDGMIYVLGPGNTAYGYVPETDSWMDLEPMPGPAVGVAAINGSIYAIGPEHTFQGVRSWPIIYSNDFENEVGSKWSSTNRDTTPVGDRNFLGQFCNDTVALTLNDLSPHTEVTVSFDLFVICSWDGNHPMLGPDIWDLSVTDGQTLLHTTFSNIKKNPVDHPQTYPDNYPDGNNHSPCAGAIEVGSLGYTHFGDSVYHLSYTFSHNAPSVQLSFSASGLQGLADESWGLDNVKIRINETSSPRSVDWIKKTTMPVSVEAFGYAVLNEDIYIIGGDDISGSSSTAFQRYTPATDTWEADTNHGGTLAYLPKPRSSLYCGVINGKIHAIGGRNNDDPTCNHFIYAPDSNTWSAGPSIPQCFIGQFAATLNNTIYVFGGVPGTVFKYFEEGGWSDDGVPIPTNRLYGTAAVYNGKIYVIGGESQGEAVGVVEVYDPGSDNAIALFTENPRKGSAPLTVQFSALSDQATDWVWDFGDEYDPTPGNEKKSTHTYSQPGNYTVSLTVTGQGESGTVTKPAHIQVGMSTGPSDSSTSFKWTALALSGEDADTPPIASDSENSMTIFIGHPVIGGTSLEGYVSQTRRGDQIMWSGPLPIQ